MKLFNYTIAIFLIFIFVGCSGKSQINPDPYNNLSRTNNDSFFYEKKADNKALEAQYKAGEEAGYNKAKKDFEKIIPYLEAIRASAELRNAGGLCLPPIFLDKSESSSLKVRLGEVHICDNFTVDKILEMTKNGIPALPRYNTAPSSVQENSNSNYPSISGIEIAEEEENDFFIEKPEKTQAPIIVKVKNNVTNRQIIRESSIANSSVSLDSPSSSYLQVSFKNSNEMKNFCGKFNICEKA